MNYTNEQLNALIAEDHTLAQEIISYWKSKYCPDAGYTDCWICNLRPNKVTGYVQGSYKGANKFAVIHRVAYLSVEGHAVETRRGYTISHLCHHPTCFNPAHLTQETALENQRRKGCVGTIVDLDGVHYTNCTHTPTCLTKVYLNQLPVQGLLYGQL